MKEKTFQRNEKKMRHLSQLIIFEKSYLFNRYSKCHNIKCSYRGIVYFFGIGISPRGVVDKRYAL